MSKFNQNKVFVKLIVTIVLGILFFHFGFNNWNTTKYAYFENNSVDYKVYLKENPYFENTYLDMNKTYITSLINYIDASFNYNVNFAEEVSGALNYQIIAEIVADKKGNDIGNYWTKKYELTELKTEQIQKQTHYLINITNRIEYNQYNDLLNEFIKEYELEAESTLKVSLVVTGKLKTDKTKEEVDISSKVALNAPLSKKAIEGKIVTESNNQKKDIILDKDKIENIQNLMKSLFIIDVFVFCYYLFQCIENSKKRNGSMSYRKKIEKILDEYDGIIARVKNVNIDNFIRIDVKLMDDLINVYTSIREPINFWYGSDQSIFFIINNSTCYVYTIIKEVKK